MKEKPKQVDYLKPGWQKLTVDFQKTCETIGQALADSIDADIVRKLRKIDQ